MLDSTVALWIAGTIITVLTGLLTGTWIAIYVMFNRITTLEQRLAQNYHTTDEVRQVVGDLLGPVMAELQVLKGIALNRGATA